MAAKWCEEIYVLYIRCTIYFCTLLQLIFVKNNNNSFLKYVSLANNAPAFCVNMEMTAKTNQI